MTEFELRNADCTEALSSLSSASIDLVVTSPPYNLGIAYGKYRDRESRSDFLAWCNGWGSEVRRVMKDDASFFLNIGASPANPLLPHQIAMTFSGLFALQNTIHWVKSIGIEDCSHRPVAGPGAIAPHTGPKPVATQVRTFGHFKPINSPRFLNDCHEYLFHFTKSGRVQLDRLALGVPYQDKSNISRWSHTGGRDVRCRGNTWFVPYATIRSRNKQRPHPATFPVELAENCIRLHGVARVNTMLDPFLGIGNSAVAAQRCGVPKFIGFDIDESYVAEAARRIAAASSSG